MFEWLSRIYYRLVLGMPWLVVAVVALLLVAALTQARHFQLDASSESLMIEGDADMQYYREIRARYGSDSFLFVTWTPDAPLLTDDSLARLKQLRDDLEALEAVESVTSILDVPLIDSPRMTLSEIQRDIRTLLDEDTDRTLAREELRTSPLYRDLLVNRDFDTTMLLVTRRQDETARRLFERREALRVLESREGLEEAQARELAEVEREYARVNTEQQRQMERDIAEVRAVLDQHRNGVRIHLGGVSMIAADMMAFVRDDIRTFGIGVALFILALLALAFGRVRWVLMPALICAGVSVGMIGFIGFMAWPVTVVSSNFISLVLILTLSLIVHLIVRYRELYAASPDADVQTLLRGTIDSKFRPSLYTALTTMVAFGAMIFAEIRPVMDFGLMMVCAVAFALVLTLLLFPALLRPFGSGPAVILHRDITARLMASIARLVQNRAALVWLVMAAVVIGSVSGMARLTVENRFIDYFHEDTEIYQGMMLIDRELGGTTPLDIILDADPEFLAWEEEDDFDDEFAFESEADSGPVGGYWFDTWQLEEVEAIHDYLDSLPETGQVLSVATAMRVITHLNRGERPDPFALGLIYQQMPDELREILFDPYMSEDGNQLRMSLRIIDSDPDLRRDAFLRELQAELPARFGLEPEQVNLTGMMVLYNNVMQSLLRSQYVTMTIVFVAIMLMFGLLFRSLRMALIGPLPTLIAACAVLGLMGWLGIPLDMMTMTIAAITIGIGVHDTIHYTDRFGYEVRHGRDYASAMDISHVQVGRAMFYTTVIITAGFSILVLSNFVPTLYFGLFTGVAMLLALAANLTLLPLLLQRLQPFINRAAAGTL